MISFSLFVSSQFLHSNRRVARRVAALSHLQIARQFNDVQSFLDGTDLCSRGLRRGRRQGGSAL